MHSQKLPTWNREAQLGYRFSRRVLRFGECRLKLCTATDVSVKELRET